MPCPWDSRECPGPISEATLHRPSACRALTAGAIALAVVTPALEPVEQANAALQAVSPARSVGGANRPESAVLDPESAFLDRAALAQRASRAMRPALRLGAGRSSGVRDQVAPASRRSTRVALRLARAALGPMRTADALRPVRSAYALRPAQRAQIARRPV